MVNKKAEGTYEDTLNKSEAFFVKHGKTVIIAIAAVIVVVAGVFLYRNFIVEPQEEEASTELAQAQKLFQTQQYDQALKAFKAIIAAPMQAILPIFTSDFAMHTRKNPTGQRLWRTSRSSQQPTIKS